MMKSLLVGIVPIFLILFATLSTPAIAASTQCELHNDGKEFRCAKDNFAEDKIVIVSVTRDRPVKFMVSKWSSTCGKNGEVYFTDSYTLPPLSDDKKDEELSIPFEKADKDQCKELFVYDCEGGLCPSLLRVRPSTDI